MVETLLPEKASEAMLVTDSGMNIPLAAISEKASDSMVSREFGKKNVTGAQL